LSDAGREFEDRFAESIGGTVVPNSGQGRWAKMDVRGLRILFSCKWTGKDSRRVSEVEFDEVMRAVRGPGGVGGDVLPAMAIGLGSRTYVVMEAGDFADLVINREPEVVTMDRSESRRAHALETPLQRRMREGR
jgi:hypothetical protein